MELYEINTDLVKNVTATFDDFINQLKAFNNADIDKQPAFGGWTPGEVAEHIIKTTTSIPDGETRMPDRPYDMYAETVKDLFQDFENKMQSPEFALPTQQQHNKEEQFNMLERNKAYYASVITEKDLEPLCLGYEFKKYSFLTRYEWVIFTMYHIKRHTRQLKNIYEALNA